MAIYPIQQLHLSTNPRVHCYRVTKFRQSFTPLHLVIPYQVLNRASFLSHQVSYCNTERRSIRKQSRLLENMLEIYAMSTMHTVFQGTKLLGQQSSTRKQGNA